MGPAGGKQGGLGEPITGVLRGFSSLQGHYSWHWDIRTGWAQGVDLGARVSPTGLSDLMGK